MADEQLLETSSQQDESIEIRHRAMTSCTESSTLPLLTMGEDIQIDVDQDTISGEHLGMVTVPTIVTVEEPSQAVEGKYDSQPLLIESFSPLPEGTSLSPLRYFPLAALTGESGRQLDQSITEAIRVSIPNDPIDLIRDRDLRIPIAPPLTSLEGSRVISIAGIALESDSRGLILSETHTREESDSNMRAI